MWFGHVLEYNNSITEQQVCMQYLEHMFSYVDRKDLTFSNEEN